MNYDLTGFKNGDFEKNIVDALENVSGTNNKDYIPDERIIYPMSVDGKTTVLEFFFLPDMNEKSWGSPMNFLYDYKHKFKIGNQEFKAHCPVTIKKNTGVDHKCPVCESISGSVWEEDPDTYRERKKKLLFTANILVVNDSVHSEYKGKVKIIRLNNSQTLFQIIEKHLKGIKDANNVYLKHPKAFFNPFKTHKITITSSKDGQYDKYDIEVGQEFNLLEIFKTEEKLKELLMSCHNLEEFIKPDRFMSYEEILEKLKKFNNGEMDTSFAETKSFNDKLKKYQQQNETEEEDFHEAMIEKSKEERKVADVEDSVKKEKKNEVDELDFSGFFDN